MNMDHLYPRVVRAVREQPWALMPEKLAVMLDLLRFRAGGGRLTQEEIQERLGEGRAEDQVPDAWLFGLEGEPLAAVGRGGPLAAATAGQAPGSVVAVLPVHGVLTQRADMFSEMSGGTSIERLTANFRAALADPAVRAIVFDHDSPGGGVYGVQELADEMRAARGRKPTEAVSNSLMASAAYWLGSQADRVSVTPSGQVGSIGVYAAHADLSQFYEQLGEKWTLLHYGENKVLGNPFEPLSDEARQAMQESVDEYGRSFDQAVAKGRGVSAAKVRSDFGQGLVFGAREAVERGLADRVASLEDVVRGLAGKRTTAAKAEGPAPHVVAEWEAAKARARVV